MALVGVVAVVSLHNIGHAIHDFVVYTEEPTSANELYRAYDHMTTLLLFVGYSRSRHSLVSSLLDAHPHVIVADESYALRKWVQDSDWKTTKSKYDFFDTMMGSSVSSFKHGRRSRDTKGSAANLQIFGYNIPDQWQATYDRHIQVQYRYIQVQYWYSLLLCHRACTLVLLSSFHLNGHTVRFHPQTQKVQPHLLT